MAATIFQSSFAAGELSPGLNARVDYAKYKVGASLLLNQYVDVRGGVSNRPGTSFVGRSKQTQTGAGGSTQSAYGMITGWINPVGLRTETTDTLCSGNQIVFQNAPSEDFAGKMAMYWQNQGVNGGHGGGGSEIILPGKLNIVITFQELFSNNGTLVNLFQVSTGDFWNATATYPNCPADGFPVMFTWDFTTANWTAAIWMGNADGTWTRVDAYCYTQINNGAGNYAATKPLNAGAALQSSFSFTGNNKQFYFDMGSEEGREDDLPPPDPYHTDMWDPCEWSQWWFGLGQSVDASSGTVYNAFYDSTSSPKWAPKNLGSGGATPTGTQPTLYFRQGLTSTYLSTGVIPLSMPIYEVTTAFDGITPTSAQAASTIPAAAGPYQAVGIRFGINNGAASGLTAGSVSADACGASPPRLIPFQFSTIQSYVLEFGDLYMRVIMNGGYVLETAKNITAITKANPAVVTSNTHGFSNGDWVYITGVSGMTQVNGKSFIVASAATNTFALHTLDGTNVDSTSYSTYTSGGTVARYFTLTTPYAVDNLRLLKYAQSADVLTITHPLYPPADITRTGNASWTYTVITFSPNIAPPSSLTATAGGPGSGTTYRYVVTAVDQDSQEESRASAIATVVNSAMSQNLGYRNLLKWTPVANAGYYNLYRQPEVIGSVADYGQIYGFIGTTTGVSFTDMNIAPDFSRSPPQARNPFANKAILYWTVTNGGSGYTTGPATVTDGTGSEWAGFIEATAGVVTAIITQNGGHDYTTPTISAPAGTGLAANATLGPASGNYPGCVSYFQQRKCFAGSTNAPETFWMSQIGNFNNMDVSVPARDSDAITGTISATQVNAIRFLQPMASGLIMGSSSGAWQVSGGSLGEAVTPSNIVASPQAFNGASDVPPIPVNYEILYVQDKANVVRDMSYSFYQNNYVGVDVTVLANSLFYGFEIVEWAYQDEPTKIVWAIRDDGTLLSFTFLKEQEIYAWAHHDTQGTWISVASISEGEENAVYLIAQRNIPGQNSGNPVYYVERMQSRQMARPWTNFHAAPQNAWFLDCALSYAYTTPAACVLLGPTTLTTDTPLFGYGSIGGVANCDDGTFDVTSVVSSTQVVGTWTVLPSQFGIVIPEGDWTFTTPVTTVTGLDHLEGASVMVLSNGSVEGPYTVVNGSVTLQEPSDVVVVGLQYTAKGRSMYVDIGGGAPSVGGKRKTSNGLSAYLENSRGLSFSVTGFDSTLVELKERTDEAMGQPTRLQTGIERVNVYTDWTVEGQVYWQSAWPLPFTLLGLATEMSFGDTAK